MREKLGLGMVLAGYIGIFPVSPAVFAVYENAYERAAVSKADRYNPGLDMLGASLLLTFGGVALQCTPERAKYRVFAGPIQLKHE